MRGRWQAGHGGRACGMRALQLLLSLVAMGACEVPTLSRPGAAYDPTSLTNGQLYRWASGRTIRIWVVPPAAGTPFDLTGAVAEALAQWNDLPLFREFRLVRATAITEADVLVMDRSTPLPFVPVTGCGFEARGSLGFTYFCPVGGRAARLTLTGGGQSLASVVISVQVAGVSTQSALDALVAHEFGHMLGIGGHSPLASDVMFGVPTVSTPSGRDAQTLQFVLGERPRVIL